jgi:hypothetical protein
MVRKGLRGQKSSDRRKPLQARLLQRNLSQHLGNFATAGGSRPYIQMGAFSTVLDLRE